MRMPKLRALHVFEVAARHLSFKDAASELNITPAAVSFQIRELEKELGVKLFVRGPNTIKLSESGDVFLPKLSTGMLILREAFDDFQQIIGVRPVRLTSGPAVMAKWFVPQMLKLKEIDQEIDVEFTATLKVLDMVRDRIDFAIRFGNIPRESEFSNHKVKCIAEEYIVPVISPSIADKVKEPDDLKNEMLIFDQSLKLIDSKAFGWEQWGHLAGVNLTAANTSLTFTQSDHAIQAAIDGTGVGLTRVILAGPDIQAQRLKIPFGPYIPTGLHYYLVEPINLSAPNIQTVHKWIENNICSAFRELVESVS